MCSQHKKQKAKNLSRMSAHRNDGDLLLAATTEHTNVADCLAVGHRSCSALVDQTHTGETGDSGSWKL
jgi:hypothetical protein